MRITWWCEPMGKYFRLHARCAAGGDIHSNMRAISLAEWHGTWDQLGLLSWYVGQVERELRERASSVS